LDGGFAIKKSPAHFSDTFLFEPRMKHGLNTESKKGNSDFLKFATAPQAAAVFCTLNVFAVRFRVQSVFHPWLTDWSWSKGRLDCGAKILLGNFLIRV